MNKKFNLACVMFDLENFTAYCSENGLSITTNYIRTFVKWFEGLMKELNKNDDYLSNLLIRKFSGDNLMYIWDIPNKHNKLFKENLIEICKDATYFYNDPEFALNIKSTESDFFLKYNKQFPGRPQRLRCGIAFGEGKEINFSNTDLPNDYISHAINLSSRLQNICPHGITFACEFQKEFSNVFMNKNNLEMKQVKIKGFKNNIKILVIKNELQVINEKRKADIFIS